MVGTSLNKGIEGASPLNPFINKMNPFKGGSNPLIPGELRANTIAAYSSRYLGDYSLPMTNAVTNGDFANGTTGWSGVGSTLSSVNNTASVTGDGTSSAPAIAQTTAVTGTLGKIIEVTGKARVLAAGAAFLYVSLKDSTGTTSASSNIAIQASPTAGVWYPFALRIPVTTGVDFVRVLVRQDWGIASTANGKVMEVQDVMCIDLSTPFGLSNEPTATEFADMLTYKGKTYWNGTEPVVINPIVSGQRRYYWPDVSGNNRHLHLINLAYDSTGGQVTTYPQNYLFDGVNDYAVYNSATDIVAANGAVSAFIVAKKTNSANPNQIMTLASSSNTRTHGVFRSTSVGIACPTTNVTSGVDPAVGSWFSVAMTKQAGGLASGVSVNGGTITAGPNESTTATTKIEVAARTATPAYGSVAEAEVFIFNKTLTLAEIKQLHNNIASRYGLAKV